MIKFYMLCLLVIALILGVFIALILLSPLIFCHEMGHYFVARFFDFEIEKFNIYGFQRNFEDEKWEYEFPFFKGALAWVDVKVPDDVEDRMKERICYHFAGPLGALLCGNFLFALLNILGLILRNKFLFILAYAYIGLAIIDFISNLIPSKLGTKTILMAEFKEKNLDKVSLIKKRDGEKVFIYYTTDGWKIRDAFKKLKEQNNVSK